jgi:pilus assembly protein Flp/PilA
MTQVKRNVREESGATAVEYALMAGLIAVVIAVAVSVIGTTLIPMFTDAANGLVGS